MGNLFSLNFRLRGQLFPLNLLISGITILLFANCSTVAIEMETQSEKLDLSISYAAKAYEKKREKSQTLEVKDPRA